MSGIQREIGSARLPHRQHRNDHPDRVGDAESHDHLRTDSELAQGQRHPIRSSVRYGIRPALGSEFESDGVRPALRARGDDLVNTVLWVGVDGLRLIPTLEELEPIRSRNQRQVPHLPSRRGGHAFEERLQVADQSVDRRRIETSRVINHSDQDSIRTRSHDESQWVVAPANDVDFPAATTFLERWIEREVFEHDHALEESASRRNVAPALHQGERSHLVLELLDLLRLDLLQPRLDSCSGGHAHADREGIGEEAHDRLHAKQRARPARAGAAKHHVAAPCVTPEQQAPSCLY